MSSYSDRVRATVEARRRVVFRDWLTSLPAGGWSGTAGDLIAELGEFLTGHPLRFGTSIPAGAGLSQWLRSVEDEVTASGRGLGFSHTRRERLITVGART